ncbi:MAG TPA: zinc ribbon domain-containing protein [Actinomycetota bacterium]|nr:zinc ribbon domain-containing protein [Actinomycetota bacterium]
MGFIIGAFLLLLVVAFLLARPLLVPDVEETETEGSVLESEKQRLLAEIRDLDTDFATGKLTEEDHSRMRAVAVARAAEILRAIETDEAARATASSVDPDGAETVAPDTDDEIEQRVAARRHDLENVACGRCGATHEPDDHFCRRCGMELTPTTVR